MKLYESFCEKQTKDLKTWHIVSERDVNTQPHKQHKDSETWNIVILQSLMVILI